ncbi:MAG: 50S ribosomal protein L4 [Sneathiella sp.]|jgi:large subunit ribosomal protein L4|uniref:50S ribosomal protein L4 n=1 Tax=Sneathiella sp. TaxID=1964365 RepID=UPI000C60F549|nr:50S ribosomal protein L4 [Sneathiella sp.]MAL79779.1 50S ribosomal protein L4 [Sneathiella sp.]|tara:strand:+ start:498 stop:1118 length:621 start_codon:yes stop_codon:yes gene_type:complete
MKVNVINLDNKKAGDIELADEVFGLPLRGDLLQRMVRYQLAARRAGTHKTKDVSEVSGTGQKPFKQKGTGRARQGQKRAPQQRGGGVAHGPVVRSHAHDLPKKVRKLALKTALSAKQAEGKLIVVDELKATDIKTKLMAGKFKALGWESALIVDGEEMEKNFALSARNLPRVDLLTSNGANVYDILRRDVLVLSKSAVESLEARLK